MNKRGEGRGRCSRLFFIWIRQNVVNLFLGVPSLILALNIHDIGIGHRFGSWHLI
jgi:hypothetical protein